MSAKQWTPGQLAVAMDEISSTAMVLERIAIMQECAPMDADPRDTAALLVASRYLAQRVGWLADMAAQCAAPGLECGDPKTPLQWSMPPLFPLREGGL